MADDQRISCKIDLLAGTAEISALPEHFSAVAKEAKELLSLRSNGFAAQKDPATGAGTAGPPPVQKAEKPTTTRAGRSFSGSPARAGRLGSFSEVNFDFDEGQQRDIHSFYQSKAPKAQPEMIATAMFKGEQLLKRSTFSYDEIYSLMRLGGERELPKALDVLLGSMKKEHWIAGDAKTGFCLKFLAKDHVEKLPKQTSV